MAKLRSHRAAWVDHCRAAHAAQEARRKDNDGMSHGIIPFGAVHHWADIERKRLALALTAPVPTQIIGSDVSGIGLRVLCPYCQQQHRHIVVPEEWTPLQPLEAGCERGTYYVSFEEAHGVSTSAWGLLNPLQISA